MRRKVGRISNCEFRIANLRTSIRNPQSLPAPYSKGQAGAIRNASGFTLVELMLVVVIIGVLAAMVVPRLAGRTEQAKISRAKSDIAAIGLALDLYELDMGAYPQGEDLSPLFQAPSNAEEGEWKGPYLKKKQQLDDPWNKPYQYKSPSASSDKDYDLFSFGSDGQAGTEDDITN